MDDGNLHRLLEMAAKGIMAAEARIADLEADAAAYRVLIGALLARDSAAVDGAAENHAAIEELTLPTTLTDGQRERTAATLGQILSAVRDLQRRHPSD